jgi:GNAT superfamily N-acetyltransferase
LPKTVAGIHEIEMALGWYASIRAVLLSGTQESVLRFGDVFAIRSERFSGTWLGSCISGLTTRDAWQLPAILDFIRDLPCRIDVPSGQVDLDTIMLLRSAGYRPWSSDAVVAMRPDLIAVPDRRKTIVRRVNELRDVELFLHGYRDCFDKPRLSESDTYGLRHLQTSPECSCYIADRSGVGVDGVGVLAARNNVAVLADSATRPGVRRQGIQGELIAARCADAEQRGCTIVVAEVGFGSPNHRTMLRAGLRTLYTRDIFRNS